MSQASYPIAKPSRDQTRLFLLWGQDDRFEAKLLVVNSTPDERPKLSVDCEVRGKRMRFLMDTSLFGDGLTQLLTQPLNHQKVIACFR